MAETTYHLSERVEQDGAGWWVVECTCGYAPDAAFVSLETAVDDLMLHAHQAICGAPTQDEEG